MTGKRRSWRSAAAVGLLAAAASAQCPSTKIVSPNPWERGNFGESVQVQGDLAVVADRSDQTFCSPVCASGAVHTFRRIDARWEFEATLYHSRIGGTDAFGRALSLDGPERFAASASVEDVLELDSGSVYIFEHDGEAWHEIAEILPVEPQKSTGFGHSLLLRGDTLIVGQPLFQITEGFVGAAWVYRLIDGRWEFAQKLMAPDPRPNAQFGNALAMDGEWLIVGAPWEDAAIRYAGAVYIYRRGPEGQFTLTQELRVADPGPTEEFGWSLALEGDRLAIGALSSDGGAVWVYELADGEWRNTAVLHHNDPVWHGDGLGWSVCLTRDTIVAGAPRHDVPGLTVGVAYAFQRQSDGSWRQAAKILPPGPSFFFGQAVATDGASVIVGAPKESAGGTADGGAAHIFDLPCLLCRADLDGDGQLTFLDFLAFQNLFGAGDMTADFDGSGVLDFFDFLAFQDEFAAGCA